jgi:hypothetical protein
VIGFTVELGARRGPKIETTPRSVIYVPPDLLSQPLADLAAAYPGIRVQARHMSTAAQLAALRAG